MNFNQLNLKPELIRAVEEKGYTTPTGIQQEAIPLILDGKDLLAQSQTGTGKTAAFGLPFLSLIENDEESRRHPQLLVLCPTRELAVQVSEELQSFAKYMQNIRIVRIYGGEPIYNQIRNLKRGADVVVATPGRLLDHIRRKTLRFDHCKGLILDEADEMLNMGFLPDIQSIMDTLPEDRQTALFSATVPETVKKLSSKILKDPEFLKMKDQSLTVSLISQHYIMVDQRDKEAALLTLLRAYPDKKTIVFCNTKRQVDRCIELMEAQNMIAMGIHGDMKQEQRIHVLDRFHKHSNAVVFATDVLARGIDVENLDLVINYDIPQENEFYVHRIGRTGRKGKSGMAITLINRRQRGDLNQLIRHTKAPIEEMAMPSAKTLLERMVVQEAAKIKDNQDIKNQALFQQVVNLMRKHEISEEEILMSYFNLMVKDIADVDSKIPSRPKERDDRNRSRRDDRSRGRGDDKGRRPRRRSDDRNRGGSEDRNRPRSERPRNNDRPRRDERRNRAPKKESV